jgi:hypothetical protein
MHGKLFSSAVRMASLRNMAIALGVILAGMLPNVAKADTLQGQPIYAQNNTNRTIWVAARFIPPGSTSYVTNGFWQVGPGERVLLLYNNGVNIYFFARDGAGRLWTAGDALGSVRGELLNMVRMNTGNGFEP